MRKVRLKIGCQRQSAYARDSSQSPFYNYGVRGCKQALRDQMNQNVRLMMHSKRIGMGTLDKPL